MRTLCFILGATVACLTPPAPEAPKPLLCYTGPSMKTSMEELAKTFEARTGIKVAVETNDPKTLIDRIKLAPTADLFISHDPFLAVLQAQKVPVKKWWTVATIVPVIVVPKGNPRNIREFEDLARPGIRLGLTDPKTAISGHIVAAMAKRARLGDRLDANVVKRTSVGRELVTLLKDGQLDAGIIWNAVAHMNRDALDAIPIRPDLHPQAGIDADAETPALGRMRLDRVRVTIALLGSSPNPDAALKFAEFVNSAEGLATFRKNGFSPAR